jgi:hypothetical protein
MMRFLYHTGEHGTARITRVYRSECKKVGKVIRTAKYADGCFGKARVRYFIWGLPDSATEYASLDDCLAAQQQLEG